MPALSRRIRASAADLERVYAREVERGAVWFWLEDDQVAATATLLPSRPDYYPEEIWNDGASAWYLCRIAVSRRLASRSVGDQVLQQVESDAIEAGIRACRLDVVTKNPFLAKYYESRGFRRVALLEMRGVPSIFLEKLVDAPPRG